MKNGEQAAYPYEQEFTDGNKSITDQQTGLTKREYFAAMAMQGMVSAGHLKPNQPDVEYAALLSVLAADALLKELEQ